MPSLPPSTSRLGGRHARRVAAAGLLRWLLGVMVCAGAGGAQAELWGYVDGQGVAHFADRAVDSRYVAVLRPSLPPAGQRSAPDVLGKTMSSSSFLTWLEFAPEVKALQPVLRAVEQSTGVDAELLKAIIAVESGFRSDLVSPRGAIGLMQLTPVTGERYATRAERAAQPATQRLRDPRHNVLIGARMLADLQQRLGSIELALAAWNAGEGSVRRHGGKMPPFDETRAHVQMVLELYWVLLQQRQQATIQDMKIGPSASQALVPLR